ncbi:MAG: hypothetical protein FWD71_15775 [Oscillospiraceae bacterium]|nr:hypothetical protein [Oscillospiraceae bacterium]
MNLSICDNLKELRKKKNNTQEGYPDGPDNECGMRLNMMKRNWFDLCREDERFKEIEKNLAKYAN